MKHIFLIAFLAVYTGLQAQKRDYVYFIAFKDKNNTAYSLKKPDAFLSEKALQRRAKYNIRVVESDIPVNAAYINKVCDKKVKFKNASKWLNGILVELSDTDLVEGIRKHDFVAYTLKVATYKEAMKRGKDKDVTWETVSPPELYNEHPAWTGLPQMYGNAYEQIRMLQGTPLHQRKLNGEGVTVAVLDAGFLNAHKLKWFIQLQQNGQVILTRDFVENDNYVFDGNSHGLQVLSCMAANDSGVYIGTAPRANYLLLRSEDAETEQLVEEINWSVAAEFADSCGVDLITSSLGYNVFDDEISSHTYTQMDGKTAFASRAAEVASSKGIVVVCSAGNEGAGTWKYIGAPADAENVLTVGGVDKFRSIAGFSSRGPTADGRTKPDVCALAVYAFVESSYGDVVGSDGTSFATPIVSGMVACLMQAHPGATPKEICDAVKQSADRSTIPDTLYGMGIPDFHLAHILLGDPAFDPAADNLLNASFNPVEKFFTFTFYSASQQIVGFKLVDENGTILRTGTQQCYGKKFGHFYVDQLVLPDSPKGYGFIIENDAHQTFIRLF